MLALSSGYFFMVKRWLHTTAKENMKTKQNKKNEKTTYRMGENICKWYDRQVLNLQNIQTAHTTQQQQQNQTTRDFPGGTVVKNPPAKAGTWVWALVREDPTCCGATKPMCHNYWACTLQPMSHNYWAHVPQLLKPAHLEPVLCNKRSHRNEKPVHHNEE